MSLQLLSLFIIALPVASIAWTITHEELFREFQDRCLKRNNSCKRLYQRKLFYMFTCEYCFSHYVTLLFLVNHEIQASLRGLARIPGRGIRASVGRQRIHGIFRQTSA
jgi:hypothetical protein